MLKRINQKSFVGFWTFSHMCVCKHIYVQVLMVHSSVALMFVLRNSFYAIKVKMTNFSVGLQSFSFLKFPIEETASLSSTFFQTGLSWRCSPFANHLAIEAWECKELTLGKFWNFWWQNNSLSLLKIILWWVIKLTRHLCQFQSNWGWENSCH